MTIRFARTLFSAAVVAFLAAAAPMQGLRAQPAAQPSAAAKPSADAPGGETPSPSADAPSPAPSEPAPSADEAPRVRTSALIDQAKGRLDQVTVALRRDSLDDATLASLKDSLGPASGQLQQAIDMLGPRLADAKDRLDKLGPKPDAKAPPESADVTRDREDQQKRYARAEELLKRAQLLALQIDQTNARIVSRRRALFVGALMQRSYSLLSPALWTSAATDLSSDLRALATIAGDFVSNAFEKLSGWRAVLFFALLGVVGLLNLPVYRLARRILSREPTVAEPGRFRKALGALWTALVAAAPPIFTVMALFLLLDAFDLMSARITPLKRELIVGVAFVAAIAGVARGLFAPTRPSWRLIAVDDAIADRLSRLAIAQAAIVAAANVLQALTDISAAALPVTAAVQGLGAVVFAVVTAGAIYGLGEGDEDEACLGPRVVQRPRWIGLARLAAWIAIVAMSLAALLGYIPAAAFLMTQFVWIIGVVGALCILTPLATAGLEAAFQPTTSFGRTLMGGVGLRREGVAQIGIVLSGLAQLFILAIGFGAIVVPWGLQSDDVLGGLRNAFFGFSIGGVTISPSAVVAALVLFALVYVGTRALQNWLDNRLMPATSLDAGLRNSIRTSVGYVGLILAISIALSQIGLGLDKIAIVAGALSVGIGFGLQSIFNNFVSGIIVLWERSIRVGDLVVLAGDEQGYVRKINVRATEIETFDRATMIVPNSNLITGVVKNWVRNDRVARVKIPVTLNVGVDPEKVREIMTGAAKENEKVAKIPAPSTLFVSMEPGGLKFELVCFVDDVETSGRTKSELHYAIFAAFKEAGIPIFGAPVVTQVALQGEIADALADRIREGRT
ncbi:MAG TPA: DUF3772 domain-containing protein [Rhodoblastus sp.]|nr:DUF3772 domain-containing protein [Rhodoblastus sp.]